MRFLIITLSLLFFFSGLASAGVSDIRYMERKADDKFHVECSDGESETATAQDILKNAVCGKDTIPSSSDQGISCTGNHFKKEFYVTRNSDGKRIGDAVTYSLCQKLVDSARKGLVCTGNQFKKEYYVTSISAGKQLGGPLSLRRCENAVKSAR